MTDVAPSLGVSGGAHTIGSAWGDMDNDGFLDLFVGNFSHSGQETAQFLRNPGAGGGAFQLMDTLDGGDWQESYASPAMGDYDNDGDLDLFFTAVYGGDNSRLYRNDGNWNFTNVTAAMGLDGLGTYQAGWADVDNDGDLDLVTAGRLFINDSQSNGNHWLKVHLEGDGETINSSAIGAQVRVYANGEILTRQVEVGTGAGNQNDLTLHFGLGSHSGPVNVEILWPEGTIETIDNVQIDQLFQWAPGGGGDIFVGPGNDWNDDANWLSGTSPGDTATVTRLFVQDGATLNYTSQQGVTRVTGEGSQFSVGRPGKGNAIINITGGSLILSSEEDAIIGAATDATFGLGFITVSDEGRLIAIAPLRLGDRAAGRGYLVISDDGRAIILDDLTLGSNGGTGKVTLNGNASLTVGGLIVNDGNLSFSSQGEAGLRVIGQNSIYYQSQVALGNIRVDGVAVSEPFDSVFWVENDKIVLASSFNEGFRGPGNDWNDDANWIDGSSPGDGATIDDVLYVLDGGTVNYTSAQGTTIVTGRFGLGRADAGNGTMNISGGTLLVNSSAEALIGTGGVNGLSHGFLYISDGGAFISNGQVVLGDEAVGVMSISQQGRAQITGDLLIGNEGGKGMVILADSGSLSTAGLVFSNGWINFNSSSYSSLSVTGQDQTFFESLVADQWIRVGGNAVETFADFFWVDGDTLRLLTPPIPGDINIDGRVDAADAAILVANWQTLSGATRAEGDLNDDGRVDDADATILAANWSPGVAAEAAVPEPGTLVLLAGMLAAAGWRRRRK